VELHEQQFSDVLVLGLSGKVNRNGADAFRGALIPYVESQTVSYQMIVLNLADVEYMSSVGLRALMLAAKKSKTMARPIVVAGLDDTMQEIFQISRFHLIFEVYDDVLAAISDLSSVALAAYCADLAVGSGQCDARKILGHAEFLTRGFGR
jgi:anti-sigma B factor antagonist